MPPRFFVALALASGETVALPAGASRHAQVLRLQPGDPLTLFNGEGGEFSASVVRMGRSDVEVVVGAFDPVERELPIRVVLAFGMPANDRMDWLVEKATELGAAALQPLICGRSVLRLHGDRAEKKRLHWQAVAVAASEQSRRTRIAEVGGVAAIGDWLGGLSGSAADADAAERWLLTPADARRPRDPIDRAPARRRILLSGPEGGLTSQEESAARAQGFRPLSLGPRVLRADTAPIAALAALAVNAADPG